MPAINKFVCFLLIVGAFISVCKDYNKSQKTVEIKVFLNILLVDGMIRIRIQIRIRIHDEDPGGQKLTETLGENRKSLFYMFVLTFEVRSEYSTLQKNVERQEEEKKKRQSMLEVRILTLE
jgi:hypothetical protein